MVLVAALALPAAAAALTAIVGWRPWVGWFGAAAAAGVLATGIRIAQRVLDEGPITAGGSGALRADALSAFMVVTIGTVALLAAWASVPYMAVELRHRQTTPNRARAYGILLHVFVGAMLLAVLADNLGVMWVAIEATTVATVFLVGHRRTRNALEASWKYLIIGSVGIALALLGTIVVYFASAHGPAGGAATLDWSGLRATAGGLDPGVMRLAVALLVLGYGTKVGLAPMHTWLPDAHSQAPAPVSALMSGVLLSVAFYAILRCKVLADIALGPAYTRGLLIAFGLASITVAASLLIAQRDFKRMLAYSSIEHMGIIAIGAAIGSELALAGALLHMLGHGLAKTVAFLGSGELAHSEATTQIAGVRGLLSRRPFIGGTFLLALAALLGLPPFGLFASEIAIARAGVDRGLVSVVAVTIVLLVVVFAAVAHHGQRMLLGEGPPMPERYHTPLVMAVPLIAGLGALAVVGISTWPLDHLLEAAARVASR